MLLKLPIIVIYKIFSFMTLKQIYKRIARLNKEAYDITKNPRFIQLLQSLYFTNVEVPLKKAKRIELPFYGFQTDAHCPNPEQWIDQIFIRTESSLVILQNCKWIRGSLSERNIQFKQKIKEFIWLVSKYLNTYKKEHLYEVQIAKIYELTYKMIEQHFNIDSNVARRQITEIVQYFWDRIKLNQLQIQQQSQQLYVKPDFKGIIKTITIQLANDFTQQPSLILISTEQNTNFVQKKILRTNIPEYRAQAIQFDNDELQFGYCIYQPKEGPIALFQMKDKDKVKLQFNNFEIQIVEEITVHLIEFNNKTDGQPGTGFQYISLSGYQLN